MNDITYTSILMPALINQVRKNLQSRNEDFVMQAPGLREFRTITLGLPRQSGKTTAVFNTARKQKSVVIVPSHVMLHAFLKMGELQNCHVPVIVADGATSISDAAKASRDDPLRIVLVDEYTLIDMDAVYNELDRMHILGLLSSDFLVVRTGT